MRCDRRSVKVEGCCYPIITKLYSLISHLTTVLPHIFSHNYLHQAFHYSSTSLPPLFQVQFNPQGSQLLTCSADKTARIWDVGDGGVCRQVLSGHIDEVFSAIYNYEGDVVITGEFGVRGR